MAFVFSSQRWKNKDQQQNIPGPGTYCYDKEQIEQNKKITKVYKGRAFPKSPENSVSKQIVFTNNTNQNQNKTKTIKSPKRVPLRNVINIHKKSNNCSNKMINVKSLESKNFSLKTPEYSANNKIIFNYKPTAASIKHQTQQNFYIGPPMNDKSAKIIHQQGYYTQKRMISPLIKQRTYSQHKNQWVQEQQQQANLYRQIFKQSRYNLKRKIVTAEHPFRKKQKINDYVQKPQDGIQLATRISDSQQDDELEEISETPGPGYYNIQRKPMTTKKSMMFTEYQERFEGINKNNDIKNCSNQRYHKSRPHNNQKRIKSRASQKKVGFGRMINANENVHNNKKQQNPNFYQDRQNIENRAFLNKIHDQLKPGSFGSAEIPNITKQKKLDFLCENYLSTIQATEQILKQNLDKNMMMNTYQFKSKNMKQTHEYHRDQFPDFYGQNYKTIQNDVQKLKLMAEDKNQNSLFPSNSSTKLINSQNIIKKVKSQLEIKHGLILSLNGFRQRDQPIQNKQFQSYTFAKCSKNRQQQSKTPGPAQYCVGKKWIKKSHNKKFEQKI